MMKKKIIAILLSVIIWIPYICLAESTQYCSTNSTLTKIKEVTFHVYQKNITRTINVTEDVFCYWGCSDNDCLQPPWILWAIILGIVIFFALIYFAFFR
jgi:hypothetical protein